VKAIFILIIWSLALIKIIDISDDNRFVMFILGAPISAFMVYLFIYIDKLELKNKDD
jgi:hypothetical protein